MRPDQLGRLRQRAAASAPRRNHKRGLILTGAVALAAGAATGGLIGSCTG